MKLSHKQFLSSLMIAGDILMAMIALALIFEEDLVFFGVVMLAFLAIDIYLTIDYIRAIKHRIKVENSLKSDNARAGEIRRRYDELSREQAQRQPRQRTQRRAPQNTAKPAPKPAESAAKPAPAPQGPREVPVNEEEEEDLSEILKGPALPGNEEMHG